MAELAGYDRASSASGRIGGLDRPSSRLSFWAWLFIIGLTIPLFIFVGPLRLSVYRIVLLLLFFPTLYMLLSGKVGRVRLPDVCVILICIWSTISLIVVHGFEPMVEWIGVTWIETLGAYLVGRCFIRSPDDFYGMARFLFRIGLVMLPLALYEMQTGRSILIRAFDALGPVYTENNMDGRLGFERVQGPFAHPIHFGVFFGAMVGLAYYVLGYGRSWLGRVQRAAICVGLCFSSLSSGPLAAAMAQIYFLLWDGALKSVKSRWNILAGLSALAYVVVDTISNRTPFHVFISYFAFSTHTAYNRIRIWTYGTQSIWENPLFGIGLNDNWTRPSWMSPSVDMFWIVPAMRHGVPVWVLWLLLFFWVFLSIASRRGFGERLQWYRIGYLSSMTGLFIAGWTVHYWDGLYAYFTFLLASGVWMLDWRDEDPDEQPLRSVPERTELPYSRFRSKASTSPGSELPPKLGH